jgi:L-alanine-DL-glutamate epimerase-like enolase superfamily enzyme
MTTRRSLLKTAAAGAAGFFVATAARGETNAPGVTREQLDKILDERVLTLDFLKQPVTVASIELLRNGKTFMMRARSADGVEAVTVPNSSRVANVWPLMIEQIFPVFVGQDARKIESLIWDCYRAKDNYKYQGMALWIGVMAVEQVLLELMGKTAKRPVADFFGGRIREDIPIYVASGVRGNTPEEEVAHLQQLVADCGAKALKFRLGGRMSRNVDSLPGRTEKLIPLVRRTFGDQFTLYADANSSYDVENAIRVGKLMQDHGYAFYEEPVEFDDIFGCKAVADALKIPVALGEQEFSLHRFRWCIENRAADIMQPDLHYFGGMIRSTRVARMAAAARMPVVPHMSGGSLGYLDVVQFASFTANIGPYMEFKGNADIPVSCATSSLKAENGVVKCPSGPGFGVTIDPDFIAKATGVRAGA